MVRQLQVTSEIIKLPEKLYQEVVVFLRKKKKKRSDDD